MCVRAYQLLTCLDLHEDQVIYILESCCQIVFKSDEYLAQVTGTHGVAHALKAVTSLTFITNKRSYGPFGTESGTSFQTSPNSRVLGFYGRCGWMVDQLGAFVAHSPLPVLVSEPWGGVGGSPFYDGRGEISQITVVSTSQCICRLQVTYLQGGEPFAAPTHGTGQGQTKVVRHAHIFRYHDM
jgi:hypothetical protein